MEKFSSKVGNSIEFVVDIGSGDISGVELELFLGYSFDSGFSESAMTLAPNQLASGEALFIFDTDSLLSKPGKIYMHFRATKDNMKINDYFQIKFAY